MEMEIEMKIEMEMEMVTDFGIVMMRCRLRMKYNSKLEMMSMRLYRRFNEYREIMKAQKEREITPSQPDSAQGKMEEALISSVIQKLHIWHIQESICYDDIEIIEEIANELRKNVNFLRDKPVGGELEYFRIKVMENALHLIELKEKYRNTEIDMPDVIQRTLREIRMRIIKSGADWEERKALISSVIQKLEHHHVEVFKHVGEISEFKGVIDELKMILDFLRDKNLAEVRRLDCLICEAVEMALYLDITVGTFYLWMEAKFNESKLREIKDRMLNSGADGEDPVTLILLVIQNLDAWSLYIAKDDIVEVMDELGRIRDFLRKEKMVHKYLISDLIDIALYFNEIENTDNDKLCKEAQSVKSWLREIRLRMSKSEAETRSEDVGEEGEEVDHVVVGLDEQVRLVLGRAICNEGKGLQTALITGMVGIGKTSLARHVYNHATVVDHFERRAWVYVSTHSTHKEILMKLIQQLVVDDSSLIFLEEMGNRSLQHLLRQHLQGMSYLIVLDDLPRQMHLKSFLNNALPDDGKGSRLLVTSRSKKIQTSIRYTHVATPLDSDNSWELFLNTIFCGNKFSSEHKFPKHLEKKGKEMLTKCGGLPLVIKSVALQFAEKRRRGCKWEELVESIDWDSNLELLENFYQQMDRGQKTCFLHLALFKENMRVEKLIHVLVAGGVESESDAVVTCLKRLYRDSIIEFNCTGMENRRIKSYDINVVLHRLSMKKAEEEIGFQILSNYNANDPPSQTSPRHRIINCSREKFDYSTNQGKHLVSLFFRGGSSYLDDTSFYWKSVELELRILDLEDFGLKILPECIGTLTKLRYLGLRNNYLQKLPDSLEFLEKLEILDVAQNFLVEVPYMILSNTSLRRVYMSDAIFEEPLDIYSLRTLKTVMCISVNDLIIRELSTSEKLNSYLYRKKPGIDKEVDDLKLMAGHKRLCIEEVDANSDVSKLFESLDTWYDLKHVILRGFRFRSMPHLDELCSLHRLNRLKLEGLLPRLPSADSFLRGIIYLKLVNSCLDEDPMLVLEQLPYLKHLKLRNAYTGPQMVMLEKGFRSLNVLCIEELWNLRNIHVEEGALRRLKKLEIKNCPHLETLPEEIGSIYELEEFIMTTTKNIAMKIRKLDLISRIKVVHIDP